MTTREGSHEQARALLPTLNVVLTGASGFLGRAIVREFMFNTQADCGVADKHVRLFLPIRTKNGRSGAQRCEALFEEDIDSTFGKEIENRNSFSIHWIDPDLGPQNWPSDTNIVVFCAFDTAFHRACGDMARSSVQPIVEGLRHCTTLSQLERILVVSTVYVQPPLPFARHQGGTRVTDWVSTERWGREGNPMKVYEALLSNGDNVTSRDLLLPEKAQEIKDFSQQPSSNDHPHVNSYIFCKTLLEAILETSPDFASLRETGRLSVIRPSIIGASVDGKQWNVKSPGCTSMYLACESVVFGKGIPWLGAIDVVPVNLVARDAVAIATQRSTENHSRTTESDHSVAIHYASNGIPFSAQALCASCGNIGLMVPLSWISVLRRLEYSIAELFGVSKQLRQFYDLYEYFLSHTWDLPTVYALDVPRRVLFTDHKSWVQREKERQKKRRKPHHQDSNGILKWMVVFVPVVALLAVLPFVHPYLSGLAEICYQGMSLESLELVFRTSITPVLVKSVPYSGLAYVGWVLFAVMIRKLLAGPTNDAPLVPPRVLMAHNMFLVLQSAALLCLSLHGLIFTAAQLAVTQGPDFTILDVLTSSEKYAYPHIGLGLGAFLLSKVYEWVDTLVLVMNNKPLGLLHLWHHSTIMAAFYHGFWTGAAGWIGVLNSLVHVIMYLYYSGICKSWIRPVARRITTLQILHLVGGLALGIITFVHPAISDPVPTLEEDVAKALIPDGVFESSGTSSIVACSLLGSYVFLFMAYYGRRYCCPEGQGSLWMLLGGQKFQTFVKERVQDRVFEGFRTNAMDSQQPIPNTDRIMAWLEAYLIEQGLLVSLSEPSKNPDERARSNKMDRADEKIAGFRSSLQLFPHPPKPAVWCYNLFFYGLVFSLFVIWPTWAVFFQSPRDLTSLACLVLVIIVLISATFTRQSLWLWSLAFAQSEANLEQPSPTKTQHAIDVVVVIPVYDDPLELVVHAVTELSKNQVTLCNPEHGRSNKIIAKRIHVVVAQEGKYWDQHSPKELFDWQGELIQLTKPRRIIADRGACSWDDRSTYPKEYGDAAISFGAMESGPRYLRRWLGVGPDFTSQGQGTAKFADMSLLAPDDNDAVLTSLHFFMHPAPGAPGRRPGEIQCCGANIQWAMRQFCGFLGAERSGNGTGSDDILFPFPGRAVVVKLDAGAIPGRNYLNEIGETFYNKWLSQQPSDHYLFGHTENVTDSLMEGTEKPSADTRRKQRLSLLSNFLNEDAVLPPLLMHPLVLDTFGWSDSSPVTRCYSMFPGFGQVLLTGIKMHAYCNYVVPFYDLVRAGMFHPDFVTDEPPMASLLYASSRTGEVTFAPLDAVVWKAVPIGLVETVKQQARFESGFHCLVPWILCTLGMSWAPTLIFRYMLAAGQACLILNSCLGCVIDALLTGEVDHHLLSLAVLHVSFMLSVAVFWPLAMWKISVNAVRRDLAPRLALERSRSDMQHSSMGSVIVSILENIATGLPVCVPVTVGLFWRACWIEMAGGGWKGQTHTNRKKPVRKAP